MFLKCFGNPSSSETERPYPTVIEELCHHFSLTDLRKSTNNFDESRVIGRGGFSTVYKGYLLNNDDSHHTIAVKRFDGKYSAVFKNEVELLCQLHHPKIVSLIGFCNHKEEKIIVFEYMSNGSLHQHLEDGELSWKKRLEICIGVARGLHYLQAGAKRTIIHHDIKPGNILLDDKMEPKLADFGLSLQGPRFMSKPKPIKVWYAEKMKVWSADLRYSTHTGSCGTLGYRAMEYINHGTTTDKYDVYSFGVVLLNVLWGRSHHDMIVREIYNVYHVEETIDPKIKGKIAPECWQVFVDIIERCVKYEPDERPTMGEVEVELECALSLQEQADIANTSGEYTLLSDTTIYTNRGVRVVESNADESVELEYNTDEGVELESNAGDSDISDIEPR